MRDSNNTRKAVSLQNLVKLKLKWKKNINVARAGQVGTLSEVCISKNVFKLLSNNYLRVH
jgi:hypothetical protein